MSFNRARLAWLSVGLGTVALGLAAPAVAQGSFTLSLSSAPSGTVGTPFAITGSGTDPTDEGALYLEIDAIPASFTTTCPSGYLNGGQIAASSGGSFVAFDEPEDFNSSGQFSNPNAYTAKTAGSVLFCGYTDDGAGDTLASASEIVNFQNSGTGTGGGGGGGGGGGQTTVKPADTGKPRVTRSGNQLRCTQGTWVNSPTEFAYHWVIAGKTKPGATRSKLTVIHALRGRSVRCGVKATNSAGSASALSAPFHVH